MEEWDAAIAAVVISLRESFDSHEIIQTLAHRNQRRYVQALMAIDNDTPFSALHSALGRRIKVVCEGLGFRGKNSRSLDMFGQHSSCLKWTR